jgi:general secretion pathway protein G
MKVLVALAICLGIVIPSLCQSRSASKDQQEKERQLRTALEQIRNAIDRYHGMFIRGKIMAQAGSRGYPADLEILVKGAADGHGQTIHFLSKIPVDPMTGATDWSVRTLPEGSIFDIYTGSDGTALDGTKYKDW